MNSFYIFHFNKNKADNIKLPASIQSTLIIIEIQLNNVFTRIYFNNFNNWLRNFFFVHNAVPHNDKQI